MSSIKIRIFYKDNHLELEYVKRRFEQYTGNSTQANGLWVQRLLNRNFELHVYIFKYTLFNLQEHIRLSQGHKVCTRFKKNSNFKGYWKMIRTTSCIMWTSFDVEKVFGRARKN